MTDNQLFALIISTIKAQLSTVGLPNLLLQQAFQPTQQGVPTAPTAFIYKLFDHRLGVPSRTDEYSVDNTTMTHTETQLYETTFQISTLAAQNPTETSEPTASDVCNLLAYVLQSESTIQTLNAAGVGMLRVTEVRNPYFEDDRGRNSASPSFDFVLQHRQVVATTTAIINTSTFTTVPV